MGLIPAASTPLADITTSLQSGRVVVVEEVVEVVVVVVELVDVVVVTGTCLSPNFTSTKSSEDMTTIRELLVVACHPLGTTSDTVYVPKGMQNSKISPY